MPNTETFQANQIKILALASRVGVATHDQIHRCEIVHYTNLTRHMNSLVNNGYLNKLPGRQYYAGAKGRASAIYQLTSKGALYLRQEGHADAQPSGLKDPDAINHALAMLDCRLMLLLRRDGEVITDRPIDYGASVVRPDNVFRFKDEKVLPVMVESEGLARSKQSLSRIRKKVANLTDFFLSEEGHCYDRIVRIISLWKPSEHKRALSLWANACYAERKRRKLAALPFQLFFFPHGRFVEYAQLDKRYGGTGLGLEISKRLCVMHGSDLTVQSMINQGSTFFFSLPISAAQPTADAQPVAPPNSAITFFDDLEVDLHPTHAIMIVERDVDIRQMMHEVLEDANYVVIDFQNAESIVDVAAETQPDLIILDTELSGPDGWKLFEQLRAPGPTAAIPVLVCAPEGSSDRARALGAIGYIHKPFNSELLLNRVKNAVQVATM